MKRILSVLLLLTMLFSAAACSPAEAPATAPTPAPEITAKSATAEAQGFGGAVSVTVTVEGDTLTNVTATGDSETEGVGSRAIDELPAAMLEAGTVEVDAVSGATVTSAAVLLAAKAAYAEATGTAVKLATAMKAGTYTGEGIGYFLGEKVKVDVTVDESKITAIDVSLENGETKPILQSVIDLMVPRMVQAQSVAVDAITGATVSSNAVRTAVTEAVTAALVAGGSDAAAISAFQTVPAKVTGVTETIDTDVLVVGMGGSGTTSAVRAAETMQAAGKEVSVLAIDKAGKYGGTSSVTTEMMAINPTKIQAEFNNGDDFIDKAAMRKAWLAYTEGDAKTEMVDLMLDNSGSALDWLFYEQGFVFSTDPKVGFTPSDVYRCKYQYMPNDTGANKTFIGEYYDKIYKHYTELGGKYMLETEAYELIYDAASNTITGVKARNMDGTEYIINAKAVILATGGFAGNGEMETKYLSNEYYPLSGVWNQLGMKQNDGKMLQAAIGIGAGTYNIGISPMVHMAGVPITLTNYETHPIEGRLGRFTGRQAAWSEGDIPLNMVVAPNSLAVDANGARFASETGVAMLDPWKAGPKFYSIWSNDQVQYIKTKGFDYTDEMVAAAFLGFQATIPKNTPMALIEDVLADGIEAGFICKADTLADLAAQLGMDAATLENTVAAYNGYCETGVDGEFGKPAEYLDTIGAGPYYAVTGTSFCYSTCGGLDINERFNVLKEDGATPINGLYAVGTDSMGVLFTEKKPYVTFGGAAQGWSYTSGYLCGKIVAEAVMGG